MVTHMEDTRMAMKGKRIVDFLYLTIFMTFEIGWLIYGNTFHYKPEATICKNLSYETRELWILMMINMSYGYVLMVGFGFVCMGCSLLVCLQLFVKSMIVMGYGTPQN